MNNTRKKEENKDFAVDMLLFVCFGTKATDIFISLVPEKSWKTYSLDSNPY